MKLLKRTYSLPSETIERFEKRVRPGMRSTTVKDLVERWVSEQERAELRSRIVEGCREMREDYLAMEQDFHPLEEEAAREHGA